MPATAEQAAPWLRGRRFSSWREEFERLGYLIFERVLPQDHVAEIRTALAPHLARDLRGRNDFEGVKTNRVYALLAKSPLFAELVAHPLVMAFVEAELGESCLLSALLAINLQPGETVQPWHFDDSGAKIPRPRPPLGVSTFWTIDDTTELNGATEIIPGSHLWDGEIIEGAVNPADFTSRAADRETADRMDANEADTRAGRPDPGGNHELDAGDLYYQSGQVFRGPGDLLDLEQPSLRAPATDRHAQKSSVLRRQGKGQGKRRGKKRRSERLFLLG